MGPAGSLIIVALTAFGLGDVTDILESDDLQTIVDITDSFSRASGEFTESEEYYLGRSVAAYIFTEYDPLGSPGLQEYVNLVGQAVASSSPRPSIFNGYHFLVLDSEEINALSCPGGLIMVTAGLLRQASDEDELAAILAHEVAHVSLRHGIGSVESGQWVEFGALVAGEASDRWGSGELQDAVDGYGEAVEDVISTLVTRGYSRETEYQADSLAVVICSRAGYDPAALGRVLGTMGTTQERSGPGFWQTHPSPEDRLSSLGPVVALLPVSPTDPVRTARFIESLSLEADPGGSGRGSSEGGSAESGQTSGRGSGNTGTTGDEQPSGGRGSTSSGGSGGTAGARGQ